MASSPVTGEPSTGSVRPLAPGVVAAVIVRHPSPHVDEVLASLAEQDYPNLQVLVLVLEADPSAMSYIASLAKSRVPTAYVRQIAGEPGFGQAINAVLKLVEGANGYFLFMRDDVSLAPDAVRILVEESFRSNAGIVGPKLVEWDDPRRLVSVGFDCDRLGEVDSGIEPHEMDQEQHDAVGDVFMLSSACLLVRADLFRALKGFESTISTAGEDLDLCWRAHMSGARVMAVPSAVARFHVEFDETREPFDVSFERERNRVLTVASLTGFRRSILIIPLVVLSGVGGSAWSLVRGRTKQARARVAAVGGLLAQFATVMARRTRARRVRRVPDSEIVGLQVRGSIRWRRMRRQRELRLGTAVSRTSSRRGSESLSLNAMVVGFGLVLLFFLGARKLLSSGVSPVGDLLPMSDSPRDLMSSYLSGWWNRDLGSASPQPTAQALMAVVGFLGFAQMGFVHTAVTIGLIPLGWLGASRLLGVIAHERARLTGIVVYAAVPLPYAAVASGRHQVLIAYAAIPWALHFLRGFGGIGGPVIDEDRRDVVERLSSSQRLRWVAKLTLLMAVTLAFSPSVAMVIVGCALLWLLAATLAGGSVRTAGFAVAAAITAFSAAMVLNLPWSTRLLSSDGWTIIAGTRPSGGREFGWWETLRFGIGPSTLATPIVLLFVPLLIAPLIARHSRFIWALRGMVLAIAGLSLTILNVSGRLPLRIADSGVLLAVAAMGLSIGVAVSVMSLGVDVLGGRFGWRQPTALLSLVVIPIGTLPVLTMAVSGRMNQPPTTLYSQMSELIGDTATGDFRTLVIGDSRLVIGGSHELGDGLSFSILENSRGTLLDRWTPVPDDVNRLVRPLIDAVAERSSLRVGRILAPLGIRYVVIPVLDRVYSTSSSPLPVPQGLVESFSGQLDLAKVYSPPSMVIFENSQWIPLAGMLSAPATAASKEGGAASLVSSELSGSTPAMVGTTAWRAITQQVGPGTFHWGVPFNPNWTLVVDSRRVTGTPSFGSVMAFDVGQGGSARLDYRASVARQFWIAFQVVLWIAVLIAIVQPRRRRKTFVLDDEPIMSMGDRPELFL